MRILILIILLQFALLGAAQSSISFGTYYQTGTKYLTLVTQRSTTEITYQGDNETLELLKSNGVSNPTLQNSVVSSEMEMITGKKKRNDEDSFPIIITILSSEKDGKTLIPNGTKIFGIGYEKKVPRLDSIVSKEMEPSFKTAFLSTLQASYSQFNFDEKLMKIGESCEYRTPFELPLGNNVLKMNIISAFKLLSIEDNVANFQTTQTYAMTGDVVIADIIGSGSGTGTMKYDLTYSYPIEVETDLKMSMQMPVESILLSIITNSSYKQSVKISK